MLYPIGIQDFEKIRNGGYVYVDKTAALIGHGSGEALYRGGGIPFGEEPHEFADDEPWPGPTPIRYGNLPEQSAPTVPI